MEPVDKMTKTEIAKLFVSKKTSALAIGIAALGWISSNPGGHDKWLIVSVTFLTALYMGLDFAKQVWKKKDDNEKVVV